MLEHLEQNQTLLILDWAMKFLPLHFREKQSDWFAQKGINWHVTVSVFKDDNGDLKHKSYTHICDGTKQDWFSVCSVLENVLTTLKKERSCLTEAFLRSDNAGCYHCGHMWLALNGVSRRTGVKIRRFDYSEAQAGKSYCDCKIAHMRAKIKVYAASGHNVTSASDMKEAIDSGSGVVGCQAAVASVDTRNQTLTAHKIKGVTSFNNICFEDDSIRFFRYYRIGEGNAVPLTTFQNMGNCQQATTSIRIEEDFKIPQNSMGKITQPQTSVPPSTSPLVSDTSECAAEPENSNVFFCTEPGCEKMFQTTNGLDNHLFTGKHVYSLQKKSTYDEIRLKWVEKCNSLLKDTLPAKPDDDELKLSLCQTNETIATVSIGWAMKKNRKVARYSEAIKKYLTDIYEEGEQTNIKSNAIDVSRKMKSIRDSNGHLLFKATERLQPSQIAAYFSRLTVLSRKRGQGKGENIEIDDTQLDAVLQALEEKELRDEIEHM
ncbi:uncharacterized protein LOC117344356 [Pecten maximus]|uniref:uncharacterized protein LOC117344356 n=1 Tax=Pecten maximus TaxID=6579 RepID=UPI001458CB25|nr:uncharacterized protein LOC117344356 [Pecten maximus]